MIFEELDKRSRNQIATNLSEGIRCYTIHTAKGLEADEVYIMDCEAGSFPSARAFKRYLDLDCEYEAAKDLINERNLLYVAITRAKKKVFIGYNEQLTPLITAPAMNEFSYLDEIYNRKFKDYDNVGAFMDLYNVGGGK
jgi:superfamily I DNA/RNA helicase